MHSIPFQLLLFNILRRIYLMIFILMKGQSDSVNSVLTMDFGIQVWKKIIESVLSEMYQTDQPMFRL